MAIIFSPIVDSELEGPYRPLPRHTFIMMHSGDSVSKLDIRMETEVRRCLERYNFSPFKATDISGTKDYLEKIVQAIRGCGFGIAIFSESTPAPTLANIFFEVGICCVFGKPVVIVKSDKANVPSDFVRTEWVNFRVGHAAQLKADLNVAVRSVAEVADYWKAIADVALDARDVDYELAFERYKQAVLITNDKEARERIAHIHHVLGHSPVNGEVMQVGREKLRRSIGEFLKLLPALK